MSWVTNVMLSVDPDDRTNAEQFSRWLNTVCPHRGRRAGGGERGSLALVTGPGTRWGGYKYPECEVYAGALNHADLDAVVERFGSTAWRVPNAAQLFLMDQQDAYFRVWMIRDGEVRQYAPTSPTEEDDSFWPADDGTAPDDLSRLPDL